MAGTITHRVEMSLTNGANKEKFQPGSLSLVQTNKGGFSEIVSVTTGTGVNATTIPTGNLTTFGMAYFQNLDADNFISLGPSTTTGTAPYLFGKLKATETAAMRLSAGIIIRASADTAAALLKVWILED